MTIKEALFKATELLKEKNIESARLDAEVLLSNCLNKDRIYLYTHPEEELTQVIYTQFNDFLNRRKNYEPIAYILKNKEFMGLNFFINENVLIPRPDTEILVEVARDTVLNNINFREKYEKDELKVLDLCCGSGAIGISLKDILPRIKLTLSDISIKALEVTTINSKKFLQKNIIIESSLFDRLKDRYDLILSNPPYISFDEMEKLAPDIVNFEPHIALKSSMNGYYFYNEIIQNSKTYLNDNGCLILEAGDKQAQNIKKILLVNGYNSIQIYKDLINIERVISAIK